MKVFVVQTLVEDIDSNSCSAEVFFSLEEAKKFANNKIDIYGEECDGSVIERADLLYQMNSGDIWVTITIEEKNINSGKPSELLSFLNDSMGQFLNKIKQSEIKILTLDWYGANIPYREVNLSHDDGSDPLIAKVTMDSFINLGLIVEGSPLDDMFYCYVDNKIFCSASDEELEEYVNNID